jgi:hypothetical protein
MQIIPGEEALRAGFAQLEPVHGRFVSEEALPIDGFAIPHQLPRIRREGHLGDEDISRFNVAVHDAASVSGVVCVGNLDGEF